MKTCSTCNIEKLYTNFFKNKSKKDGYNSQCKLCIKQYKKEFYQLNAPAIKQQIKQWKQLNVSLLNGYRKKWRESAHGKAVMSSHSHKRRISLKDNTPKGKHFTHDDLIMKLKLQHGKCVYCQLSIKDYFEIDHFIPAVKGGSNESSNIQLLCRECNRGKDGKHTKDAIDFAKKFNKLC